MEKLLEKLDILKQELNNHEAIKKVKKLNELIKKDKELCNLLEQYQSTKDERIKQEILKKDLFQEYKSYETEVNLLILEINQILKKISKSRSCDI